MNTLPHELRDMACRLREAANACVVLADEAQRHHADGDLVADMLEISDVRVALARENPVLLARARKAWNEADEAVRQATEGNTV